MKEEEPVAVLLKIRLVCHLQLHFLTLKDYSVSLTISHNEKSEWPFKMSSSWSKATSSSVSLIKQKGILKVLAGFIISLTCFVEWSKKHLERFSVCFSSSMSRQHSLVCREADKLQFHSFWPPENKTKKQTVALLNSSQSDKEKMNQISQLMLHVVQNTQS